MPTSPSRSWHRPPSSPAPACCPRVRVGAHYPGDGVAGYLTTALLVVLVSLLRPVAYRVVDRVEPTVLGTLLRRSAPATAGGACAAG